MSKRIVMLLTIILLNSCYYAQQVIDDAKESYKMSQSLKKNRGGAYSNEKYKEGVYEAIKDVAKRPMNNRVQYEGITLILPQETSINQKGGNIIDMKTGYGLPINFSDYHTCTKVFYYKKVRENLYYRLTYNELILGMDEIAQKIIKANGFTKTCN